MKMTEVKSIKLVKNGTITVEAFFSEESAADSIKKINEFADFIIPGHGGILKVYHNEEA
jgi:2-keto-3-deoxy-6-phosphogluconate aldolase